ncbi:sporulation integral membrane protein YtvI [Lachnospiraceae bacterium 10-1]|nr:sporulation integral membrane protein YtvI [Lachnospiraceae bacterium 10-1]
MCLLLFLPEIYNILRIIINIFYFKLPILPVENFEKLKRCGCFFMDKFHLSETGKKYLLTGAIIFIVYFAMKYISPIISPFIFAFLLAGALNPLVRGLGKKIKIRKSVLAGIILFLVCLIIITLAWIALSELITSGSRLAVQIPDYQEEFYVVLNDCCNMMEEKFGVDGRQIENFIVEQINIFIENLEIKVIPEVMGKSVGYMRNIVGFISFTVVMIIAILLIMKDYDSYLEKLKSEESFKALTEVGKKVIFYVKTFVRAQIIILCIISGICAVTLTIMGMEGGILYGILTGIMDMLPFIGTGIMLLPLAIFRLVSGNYWQAFICFCLYAVCALVREFLEPKLIGERVGVWPVGILFAVFAGIHLFGVWGIVKGPLALVIICESCKYLNNRLQ